MMWTRLLSSTTTPRTRPRRSVAVTGLGAITPSGRTWAESWQNLTQSSAVDLQTALAHQGLDEEQLAQELALAIKLPCQVAAVVDDFSTDSRTARFIGLALEAGQQAMEAARLVNVSDMDRTRMGVSMGSGMSGVREVWKACHQDYRRISPHFVPKVLGNSAAGRLSIECGLLGPNLCAATACAASAMSLIDAVRVIEDGRADIMLAGGAEAAVDALSLAGFCRLRALSTNSDPATASRPFDTARDGFVMGEGAAVLVLEELEHAMARSAPILAIVDGYGLSADAHHITSPSPNGEGAERAMRMALEDAQRSSIDYVNAHATSTPVGDDIEAAAIHRVLGSVAVSSTKGATGHLLGAASAVEAAATIQALVDERVPPTVNLHEPSVEGLDYVMGDFASVPLESAMSNSFGFGGTNASIIFGKWRS